MPPLGLLHAVPRQEEGGDGIHGLLYYTILYYTILYYTILYYPILYYTILYYTILKAVMAYTVSFSLRGGLLTAGVTPAVTYC